MCGRARCTLNPQQVAAARGLSPTAAATSVPTRDIDRYRPSYNVAPGAYLPVFVVRKDGAPMVWCMKWGLIPSFTKKTEKPDHYRMFNARSESVKEKASFRRLIPNNRCLVAVEGFYEWKKDGSKKQPYYIHFKDHRPLVFAALFDSWENSEGEVLHTFTILTTCSSSALQWLHDRMPVILGDCGSIDAWLNNSLSNLETILQPYEDLDLVWYPVTPAMGKPSFDGIECIKEIQIKSGGEKPLSMFFSKKTDVKCQKKKTDVKCLKETKHMKSSEGVKEELMKSYEELKEQPTKSSEEDKEGPMKSYEELKEEPVKLSDEDAFSSLKEESDADDCQQKVMNEEKNEGIEPETCGIKREYEEIAGSSRMTNDPSDSDPQKKKKGRSVKNTGDKQASLLSYFGRR